MNSVRIKTVISDDFTKTAKIHINCGDLPSSYSADDKYIYKVIPKTEYTKMVTSIDGVIMEELGIEATLDKDWNGEL